jgi:nucleoside triphosphate diphosphatase
LGLDPEQCLRHANGKFVKRFNRMEASAATRGFSLSEMSLEAMEAEWQQIKHNREFGT